MARFWGAALLLPLFLLVVPVQAAEIRWSAASGEQSLQARKVVACLVRSLGGKLIKQRRRGAPAVERAGALFGTASVFDEITIPQGSRDYYAISYFEFPGNEADTVTRRLESLNGKIAGPEPVVFQPVREGAALALVKTPEMRKAPPDDMPYIVAKVRACIRNAWR